jgi:hypothetical protein
MPVSVRSSTLYNPIIPLKTTFADCENTTSEIDIVTVTIPANIVAVGDILRITFRFQRLQNSGASVNLTSKYAINGTPIFSAIPLSVANSASTFRIYQSLELICETIVSNTATFGFSKDTGHSNITPSAISIALAASTTSNGALTSNNTFTMSINTSNSLKIANTWGTANPNTWIRSFQAQAYIIKKAV